jgi:hypothetical protein
MIFLGFLLAMLLVVSSVVMGCPPQVLFYLFFDLPTVLLILLGLAGYVHFFGKKEFVRGMKSFFAFSFPPDDESIQAGRFFLRLSEFTIRWGLLCMIFSLAWSMTALDPDTIGMPVAICLLSFLYVSILVVFVFLPIGLRLSPQASQSSFQWFAVRLSLAGLGIFFLARFVLVLILLVIQTPDRHEAINLQEFGNAVQLALFSFNPADPTGNWIPSTWLRTSMFFFDLPSLILVVAGWWAFRLASGKRRRWIALPILIFIGLLGTVLGLTMTLADLDPVKIGPNFMMSMLTTLYAFIGAAGFFIADMYSSFRTPPPLPPAEGTEQAKEIIDNVIKGERR